MRAHFVAGWRGLGLVSIAVAFALVAVTDVSAGLKPEGQASSGLSPVTGHEEDNVRRPALVPRANYVWPFGTGPVYGEVDSSRWNAPGVLHTAVGSFDLTRGLPPFPAELRTGLKLDKLGAQYFVLQVHPEAFGDGSFDAIRDAVTSNGGAIVQEMAVAASLVRLTAAGYAALQGMPGLIALEPYHPAFKLSPMIGRAPLPDPLKALSDVYTLEVVLFPGENAQAVAQMLAGLGANVVQILGGDVVIADVHRSKLAQIAALEPVYMVFEHLPNFPHGEETTTTMQTGRWNLGAIPYHDAGVRGDGAGLPLTSPQILMVLDTGAQLDAGDLSDKRSSAGVAGVAHRKVRLYTTTAGFGGGGDTLGCDAPASGGFTHGHTVSATALGNASDVPSGYCDGPTPCPFFATDSTGKQWKIDGVAPRAKLLMYDGQTTPSTLGCDTGPGAGISPGNLYTDNTPGSGALGDAYSNGARVFNFSWGTDSNPVYGTNAQKIDQFLFDQKDAMLFISAGNSGSDENNDGVPDPGTVSDPATCKSCVVVGSVGNANDLGGTEEQEERSFFSSVGPATTASNRVAPLVMAPGQERGTMGIASEYSCRTSDNDQSSPVECDIVSGVSGTSFSSPAAAGTALLIRDFFQQGFYPDGTSTNPGNGSDQALNISGALVKAILIASAEWVGIGNNPGVNLTKRYRFNNEQGYGRVQLNRALPLTTYPSPLGLIVADGGIAGGPNNTGLSGTANPGVTESTTFRVCDNTQDLSVGLAWVEDFGESLAKNLDLELVSPSGKTYFGNYYTDDNNKNGTLDSGENCDYTEPPGGGWPPTSTNKLDQFPWSLPTCVNSARDTQNPTEAVHLSADPRGNGIADDPGTAGTNEGGDNQVEVGDWTLKVIGRTFSGSQPYAVAIAGPVCLGSSTRIQIRLRDGSLASGNFVCNDLATIVVNEVGEGTDPASGLTTTEISSRTTVKVWDVGPNGVFDGGSGDDVLKDQETGLTFTDTDGAGAGLRFESQDLALTTGTAPDPGNGALDVRSGNVVQVVYQDETSGSPDPNKKRTNTARVDCRAKIDFGGIVWGQFGVDAFTLVNGGCERDGRGFFTFGFPDRYMDAGEKIGYRIAFRQSDVGDLEDVQVSLKAVVPDGDSPRECKPGTGGCADPDRANNSPSPYITVLDSPKLIGNVPQNAAVSANFAIEVASSITGKPEVEMVLGVSAKKSGRPIEGIAVSRHTLNVDETSFFYSTDFPTGGSETRDVENNETIQNPTSDPVDFFEDYQFEQRTWSDLTATGTNTTSALKSPWNFDTNNGGFTVFLNNVTPRNSIVAKPAQWGEDMDGDNVLDSGEDRDPVNAQLDNNWGTRGGCGWQTRGTGTTGGIWHTGRIDVNTLATCLASGATAARCQQYETLTGITGENFWWELLLTPEFKKVNKCCTGSPGCPSVLPATCLGQTDQPGNPVFRVAFDQFPGVEWNAAIDLQDQNTALTWELDTDTSKIEPIDLVNDGSILNFLFGFYGARVPAGTSNSPLTDGNPLFAPKSKCLDSDGNGTPDRCGGRPTGTACTSDVPCTGNDLNGSVGNNRVGDDNCAFEGKIGSTARSAPPYGLARPADDDVRNGWCRHKSCSNDRSRWCEVDSHCASPGVCDGAAAPIAGSAADDRSRACNDTNAPNICNVTGYVTTCDKDGTTTLDQFVTANGPIRNMNFTQVNGPDMRFTTLEDIYGDSGEGFQLALGFYVNEPTPSSPSFAGYGAGVDDVVVQWREYRLDEDTTNCATSGACASVELQSTNFFEGNALVTVTVMESSPYDPVNNKNDCNLDGDFTDPDDDTDCDNNGTQDIVVKVISEAEPSGEILALNRTSPGGAEWKGTIPVSSTINIPGTLFLVRNGSDIPSVTARYTDRNDGTGKICQNDSSPARQGVIEASTAVFAPTGRLAVTGIALTDNGDNDGFADTNETVNALLTFKNKTGIELTDLTATLSTSDPDIECITQSTVSIGSMLPDEQKAAAAPFVFRVAPSVNRTDVNADVSATFTVTMRSQQFDTLIRSIQFTLDLDLDVSGTCSPTSFSEGFESGTLSQFILMSLDNYANIGAADGTRCQYNDPDGPNTNSPGRASCFPGGTVSNGFNDWHAHGTSSPDGGRAYSGSWSVHFGKHGTTAANDTTRLRSIDAIRLANSSAINLGTASGIELTFKHQASFVDGRCVGPNIGPAQTIDRGVVQIAFADSTGAPVGNWIKIFPYANEYDSQNRDNFVNCAFDPTDDGNNEDSFFDPTDPFRRTGPSSTCFPEFTFGEQGNADYRTTFVAPDVNLGEAEGPGLRGAIDRGTWVQPRFNLDRFKGRRLTMRFLATTAEIEDNVDWDSGIFSNTPNIICDDGWWLDDIQVSGLCTSPLTLSPDTKPNSALPACAACTTVTASLAADPPATDAPGQLVTLNATASSADSCPSGTLQFRFFVDANGNNIFESGETLLRDWTDNPILLEVPEQSTTYGVEVRCSSAPSCGATLVPPTDTVLVTVSCPSSGTLFDPPFPQTINVSKPSILGAEPDVNASVSWTTAATVDAIRGNLNLLRSSVGNFTGTVQACIGNNVTTASITDNTSPGSGGSGLYYLVRSSGSFCNSPGSWSSGNPKEAAGRNSEIGADANTCP